MKDLSIDVLAQFVAAEFAGHCQTTITGISTDTRTIRQGDCFFAIRGDRFHGHDYLRDAFARGAVCAVVDRTVEDSAMPGPVL